MKTTSRVLISAKGALAKLPRITVTTRTAPNERANQESDVAFGVRSADQVSKAFDIKRRVTEAKNENAA